MNEMTGKTVDWANIERGVPITNDNFFVRHDNATGLIYDDQGGFIHQNNCHVEYRREITWIDHDQSPICPSSQRDVVLTETIDGELCLTSAYLVIWSNIRRYRVIRQQITSGEATETPSEIGQLGLSIKRDRKVLTTFVIFAAILLI